ncbi:polysaccharide deacetylase family protein (plasmid) [Deinococcus radiomollis]|uniref:polysaccharide deacetylase family protein n=1 Tax=Deinococcus radiomollis TaxID=468916 RepID=UPI003892385E
MTVADAVPGVPSSLVTHGPRTLRRVALTFDADMTPGMEKALQTGKVKTYDNVAVRQILRATHTPATFFFTGMWAETYPKSAREIAQDALFEVEDHSYDHPGFEQPCYGLGNIPEAHKAANIELAQAAIFRVTGVKPRYFRFPGGCEHPQDLTLVRSLGLIPLGWDVVSGDAGQSDARIIVRNVLQQARNGSIIVMHSHGGKAPATALALPAIIAGLKARGLTFVKVTDLLSPSGR